MQELVYLDRHFLYIPMHRTLFPLSPLLVFKFGSVGRRLPAVIFTAILNSSGLTDEGPSRGSKLRAISSEKDSNYIT